VPVWLVTLVLLATGSAFVAWALKRGRAVSLALAVLFLGLALMLALHAEWLTLVTLVVLLLATVAVHLRSATLEVSVGAGALASAAAAGLVWTIGALFDASAEWTAVGFSLGVVDVLPSAEEHTVVGHLGPDLLGPDWDLDEAVRRVTAEPERAVGEAILDQRNVAGIGNMYKSELCFLQGLDPWLPVRDVPDVPALLRQAKRLLEANKMRTAQATTGDTRRGRQLWVFRRDKQRCRRCGTPIQVAMQGPETQDRATYWCPACQPGTTESR
jgi:hypothetical protein